jgi:predicted DsbA family dithiol-disulfide isomerase
MTIAVKVTSDFICPWCHIGAARLFGAIETLPTEVEVALEFLPFELNPGMPKEGIDRKLYRTRKFGSWERSLELDARTVAVSEADGVIFNYERMTRTANTFDAHRLSWFAAREGMQRTVAEGILRGYFCQGRDIGDRETLADIAAEAGLDRARVSAFLESSDGADEVRDLEATAYRKNIQGVPQFDIDGTILNGAQSSDALRRTIVGVHRLGQMTKSLGGVP